VRRRDFLIQASAATGASLLPWSTAQASAVSGKDLKFLFVFCRYGWDIVQAFYDSTLNSAIHHPDGAEGVSIGDLSYVAHENRPSVTSFFESYGSSSLIVNGIWTNSIAHDICEKYVLKGTTAPAPDWASLIANDRASEFILPHVVVDGPAFAVGLPGGTQVRVGTGGKLDQLITGEIFAFSDSQVGPHGDAVEDILAAHLAIRSDAISPRTEAHASGLAAFKNGLDQGVDLKLIQEDLDFSTGQSLGEQASFAMDALEAGLCRCASITFNPGWDTHQDNDGPQSGFFESLFETLEAMVDSMGTREGATAATMADETVIVVFSEMARTPNLNADSGKDHWPVTSALLVGPGISGGRTVGGFDELFYGATIDPTTGEPSKKGVEIMAGNFGATLLQLADIDPGEWIDGFEALPGLIG
jgi:hypothetical protein